MVRNGSRGSAYLSKPGLFELTVTLCHITLESKFKSVHITLLPISPTKSVVNRLGEMGGNSGGRVGCLLIKDRGPPVFMYPWARY